MAEVFVPQHQFMTPSMDQNSVTFEADGLMSGSSNISIPEPNPPFVFPIQPNTASLGSSHARAASNFELARGRRPTNRSRPQQLSISALHAEPLPAFDFHPSTTAISTDTADSPYRSPTKSSPIPTHSGGHRRNGSELIGGDSQTGGLGLMSTSPVKGSGVLPAPSASRAGPPTGRRGHAHRRSGAVSSHDLSTILKPANDRRGSSSAPTTPSDPGTQRNLLADSDRSLSQPISTISSQDPPILGEPRRSTSVDGQPRPRVGFSDTIEFIPRPLSTISSETSSSLSTIRANHSVTNSLTSIISAGTSSPPSTNVGRSVFDSKAELDPAKIRPRSAGPVLHSLQYDPISDQDMVASKRPLSASSSSRLPNPETVVPSALPSWSNRSSDSSHQSHLLPYADGPLETIGAPKTTPPAETREAQYLMRPSTHFATLPLIRPRTSPEPKTARRQRKVKSWAGSILSRRAKSRDGQDKLTSRRSQVSPEHFEPVSDPVSEFSLEDVNFDEDTTCVIQTPVLHDPERPQINTDVSTTTPEKSSPIPDADNIEMLDLDAQWGSDAEDPAVGGFLAARRRMHSSGAHGGFTGSNMHYEGYQHRRAESAPQMVPIDFHTFGFPRLGSNPSMADVFEEEEEEEEEEEDSCAPKVPEIKSGRDSVEEDKEIPGLGVQIVDVSSAEDDSMQRIIRRRPKVPGDVACRSTIKLELSASSLRSEVLSEDMNQVEIVHAEEEPRASVITKSSDGSTITPTLSIHPSINRPASAPIDFAMPRSNLEFPSSERSPSAVSSPEFHRTSFDVPRIHTATSSITDRATLSSSRAGDQGLDMRASVEDVPSLTSSASTMISAQPHRFSSSAYTRSSAERSSSLSAAAPMRPRPATAYKRSSLASLSRLVGSSYGEKSKLSIEERVQPDNVEKKKEKKGHRISRLIRFWKSKEKLAP